MFKEKNNGKKESIYEININPKNAPDCRHCVHYWNNRKDYDYRRTYHDGYWLETTEFNENGSEKSFSRISTFKHGCKIFDIIVPQDQMPSLYIFRQIGKHCPIDISKSSIKNINKKKETESETEYFQKENKINILI
jgi:hypothetical protein